MNNLRSLVLQVRYPYTAGVIMTIWLGTTALLAIQPDLPLEKLVILDSITSVIIAIIGFSSPRH